MPERDPARPERIVRRYGMGSLLAVLSLPMAMIMAARGMDGWQRSVQVAMEKDAIDLMRRGFHIVSSQEHTVPMLGVAWYVVTYERPVVHA